MSHLLKRCYLAQVKVSSLTNPLVSIPAVGAVFHTTPTAETCGSADEAMDIMRRIARESVFLRRGPMFSVEWVVIEYLYPNNMNLNLIVG